LIVEEHRRGASAPFFCPASLELSYSSSNPKHLAGTQIRLYTPVLSILHQTKDSTMPGKNPLRSLFERWVSKEQGITLIERSHN
jgi:hypothetical protein